jgi:hypothetical protein
MDLSPMTAFTESMVLSKARTRSFAERSVIHFGHSVWDHLVALNEAEASTSIT